MTKELLNCWSRSSDGNGKIRIKQKNGKVKEKIKLSKKAKQQWKPLTNKKG